MSRLFALLSRLARPLSHRTPKSAIRKLPSAIHTRRPFLESLESRRVLSTFTVNTLADTADADPNVTSLREAILVANSQAGDDTINFSVTGTINLASPLPDLSSNIAIQGPGAINLTVRRDTDVSYRVFTVSGGVSVVLDGLSISNGLGGILNNGNLRVNLCTLSNNSHGTGGGILNEGSLIVTNSTLVSNGGSFGGGIYNRGVATIVGSTLWNNYSDSAGGQGKGGGAVYNDGSLIVLNSTFSGNFALYGTGGAIYSDRGQLTIDSSTFSGNRASGGFDGLEVAGGIYDENWPPTHTFNNSIFNDEVFVYDDGTGTYNGYGTYIHGSNNAFFIPLEPLQDNGGPTMTHAIPPDSPAINAGSNALVPTGIVTDQRGLPRFVGRIDIGAYEVQPIDTDNDGIEDAIDLQPTQYSNDFSDGTTSGTITNRGDQHLTIVDTPDGGVIAYADSLGGPTRATISVENSATLLYLSPGDSLVVTHGSVILDVLAGTIEATFVATSGQTATCSLPADTGLTFQPESFTFIAPATNSQNIEVVASGTALNIAPGETVAGMRDVSVKILPESLNLDSNGTLTVLIYGAADFNAAQIDVGSVVFAGAHAWQSTLVDANHDGQLDLQLKFRRQDTILDQIYAQLLIDDHDADGVLDSTRQTAEIELTGALVDHSLFSGADSMTLFLAGKSLRDALQRLFG